MSNSVTPWTEACQASLSITSSWSLLKLMSIKSVIPSYHHIICHPLLLLPSIFPSIRAFSNESVLLIRWPKYWSVSFSISPSNEHPGLVSVSMDWLDPWRRKIPWRRKWQLTPVFLPGKSHGQRSLTGYSPWVAKELDTV